MFTPYQRQDNARGVRRARNMNHSRADSQGLNANHSGSVGWAMSSYHSRARNHG